MFSVNNLSIHFTGEYLFDDISFNINDRDRIGLVGKNGAGKTTLLKIIAKKLEPQRGTIVIPSGGTIGYLPQEMTISSTDKVFDEAMKAFAKTLKYKSDIEKYTHEITHRTDFESVEYSKLIEKLNDANEHFQMMGGQTMEAETEKVLLGLGFLPEEFSLPISKFSGGWKMRVELAKILLQKPDLILLDEPTNHLDIESIQWLESFLSDYYGAVIIVSHDRAFLDNVTQRTIEISLGKIYDFKACYSDYVVLRQESRELQTAAFNNQQRQIAQIERFVERFRYKATKSRQVQSRIKLLDKMDRVEIEDIDASSIHFRFPPAPHAGKIALEAKNLTKRFENKLVLDKLEFSILSGDTVAFVGKNGEGKTTLSKIIVGELDHEGELNLGHNIKIGYYAQSQADLLDAERTVFETIDDIAVGDIRPRVRNILGSFLFSGETIDKKVKVLSGGEKSRLALARLLLSPVNLLVLDEPTNHLDMQSKDILKNALLQYDGTLIIVSHDRDFLQGLTKKVFEFKNRTIKQYYGDIYDFLDSHKIDSLKSLEAAKNTVKSKAVSDMPSDNKINREKKKLHEKEVRKIQNLIKKSEEQIEVLEKGIKEMDVILMNPDSFKQAMSSADIFRDYDEAKRKLDAEMSRWEKLHQEVEALENS